MKTHTSGMKAGKRKSQGSAGASPYQRDCMRKTGALGILLAALVFATGGCKPSAKPEAAATGPKVEGGKISFPPGSKQEESLKVEAVGARESGLTRLTGRLAWDDDVTVRIFSPVSGRVISVEGQVGKAVKREDVLARVASPEFWQAQTDARRAASDLALSEKTVTRTRELFAHGAAAQKDLESAETDYLQKSSEKERALALLGLYGGVAGETNQMNLYPIKALLDGTLVERNLTPGQQVRPDTQLGNVASVFSPYFVVSDPTRLWVWVDVNETGLGALKAGQKMRVYTPAYTNRVFEAQVELVGDSLDPLTRTVKVRGWVANPDRLLKAEMYVTADIDERQEAGFEMPGKTVFLDLKDNQHYLYVEEGPGVYARRRVRVGGEQNGRILVMEGLEAGRRVVVEGALLLKSMEEGGGGAS
jgi:cobalt-zinc-cadmium efflux system membrane fusion protein